MKNKYILLRHAETVKDPNKPAIEWNLTSDALSVINEYISKRKFNDTQKYTLPPRLKLLPQESQLLNI